jgi:hypothetical protein
MSTFTNLVNNLRAELLRRIAVGKLSGLQLARQTEFEQAHISNFLAAKRGISIKGMDRILAVQNISVLDLLPRADINKRASILPPSEGEFENVLLVDSATAAAEAVIINDHVRDILKFKKSFLKRLRPNLASPRPGWTRFVLIKAEADGMSMYPRLLPGATVLIDRHYNSLEPYRRNDINMYAVRSGGGCTVKYVQADARNLILRPHNQSYPITVLPLGETESASDLMVGRVCHVSIET